MLANVMTGDARRLRVEMAFLWWLVLLGLAWLLLAELAIAVATAAPNQFTPLSPIEGVRISDASPPFDGNYEPSHLIQTNSPGGRRGEYASKGLGDGTFVDFDLGAPTRVAAFEHIQRRTPDTVASAELVLSDRADFGNVLARVPVSHVDAEGATTFASFEPVMARHVRWRVTRVAPGRSRNVGGQSIRFFAAGDPEPKPGRIRFEARTIQIIERTAAGEKQPLQVHVDYPYAEPVHATLQLPGHPSRELDLKFGRQTAAFEVKPLPAPVRHAVAIDVGAGIAAAAELEQRAAHRLTVYVLPHSHTDIGYTAVQTDIEEKQLNNLRQGIADAQRTAAYPEGARFVWNVEVGWAADLYLQRLGPGDRETFLSAVRRGQVALNGMYLNELTGLCRPEELIRLFRHAADLGRITGVPVDSAMISDVPGCTWGTVSAMAQAGIRYFSVAPNYFDRIGTTLVEWENKPFWWIGPDGRSRVLVWIPFWGYAMSHRYRTMSPELVSDFMEGLERREYRYEIACVRWSGHGDNAVPDPAICEFVRTWNEGHTSPRFVISSTSAAFQALERRHGDALPQMRGDWTPYWEDGAGSSAAETAMNRASSERLTQAGALWAMLDPWHYPAKRFEAAWNNVLLYSEHTWGAHCSISEPANPFTTDQWNIKQSYATLANLQSRQLLAEAATVGTDFRAAPAGATTVDVFNTSSWRRSGIAVVPQEFGGTGTQVRDQAGRVIPAQRLVGGDLAVRLGEFEPLSGRRLSITNGDAASIDDPVAISETSIGNSLIRAELDPVTGAIVGLRAKGVEANLADTTGGHAINDYLYLIGDDPAAVRRNGPVRIRVREKGPLVASLLIESDAPGCHRLLREIRVVAGADHLELIDTVDKRRLDAPNYFAHDGKESVNFAFPFHVPDGDVRLDVPFGVIRPDDDQLPGACKNWFTIGLWADVSNDDYGVTWVTLDTPLVQVGGITATLLNSQTRPEVWRRSVGRTQKLYAWAMNNHWGTNYRAYQEGPTRFRFVLRPHRGRVGDDENSRFALELSQPLVTVPGRGVVPSAEPLFRVEPTGVLVTGLKPADDGRGWVVRLFATATHSETNRAQIRWNGTTRPTIWLSDTSERALLPAPDAIPIPRYGIVTLRVDLPAQPLPR